MLYTDGAGMVSRSAKGLAKMMTMVVEVLAKFGLTLPEKKTETLLMRLPVKRIKRGDVATAVRLNRRLSSGT